MPLLRSEEKEHTIIIRKIQNRRDRYGKDGKEVDED